MTTSVPLPEGAILAQLYASTPCLRARLSSSRLLVAGGPGDQYHPCLFPRRPSMTWSSLIPPGPSPMWPTRGKVGGLEHDIVEASPRISGCRPLRGGAGQRKYRHAWPGRSPFRRRLVFAGERPPADHATLHAEPRRHRPARGVLAYRRPVRTGKPQCPCPRRQPPGRHPRAPPRPAFPAHRRGTLPDAFAPACGGGRPAGGGRGRGQRPPRHRPAVRSLAQATLEFDEEEPVAWLFGERFNPELRVRADASSSRASSGTAPWPASGTATSAVRRHSRPPDIAKFVEQMETALVPGCASTSSPPSGQSGLRLAANTPPSPPGIALGCNAVSPPGSGAS